MPFNRGINKQIVVHNGILLLFFSHYVMFDSATPWTAAHQISLSFTISLGLLKLMSIELVMQSNHLTLCPPPTPLPPTTFSSCPQSFSPSEYFPISQFYSSGDQRTAASTLAPVLPINIQGWFPLGLIDLIPLLSKGLSRAFSSTTIWKHQFFSTQFSL